MLVEELERYISKYAVRVLKNRGIEELFPPQEEAVRRGLFSRNNMVIAVPTASGKTLIAELAMVWEAIMGGKSMYIVPLKALANEKYDEFKSWEEIGLDIGIATGDYESRDDWLGDKDIVVATAEKADSLLRNEARWVRDVSCLVVDEIHMLDSAERGPVLEVLIAKMRVINPKIRIIALSATIPNAEEIAEWLNAALIKSEWRPVPLYEGVFFRGRIELYKDGKLVGLKTVGRDLEDLVEDCLREGGQVLVFDSTRRNAERTAEVLSDISSRYSRREELSRIAGMILEESESEVSRRLAKCVEMGCAFHHAGLLNSQRRILEEYFRKGLIKVMCSTPTLAAGVNLPARRVVVKSCYRYDGFSRPIKVMEYKQMAGRAGRPGMDEVGEAIIVVRSERERRNILKMYVMGRAERITSKLGIQSNLRFHSLSLISEGFAKSVEDLEEFFSKTFFFHQNEVSVRWELEEVVDQLEMWGLVERKGDLINPTKLGRLVSKLYIDPMTAKIFYDGLRDGMDETEMLLLITKSPDMELLYVRRGDKWIERIADEYGVEDLRELKTALCLKDWINEVDEDLICEKYGIGPGDLRRIVETAEWLANALSRIGEFRGIGGLDRFVTRIRHGVKDELVELVKIKGIGRARARRLYRAGIKSLEDLIRFKDRLPRILGKGIAEKVLEQINLEQ